MEVNQVDRRETFFHNDFIEAYYNSERLNHLHSYRPDISEIRKAINGKLNYKQEFRDTLVSDLLRQYQEANIALSEDTLVNKNILLLKDSKTFTITTGQQIHIGLGPLYVLYKVLDTIAIAKECKEAYPEFEFIPVFWMATEDHDLEEIQTIPIYGKSITWETNQTGAVGRMKTDGLSDVFKSIEDSFNLDDDQLEFVGKCQQIYEESKNLSDAYRNLLHSYFGAEGVVILDADSKDLKFQFSQVLKDELKGANYDALVKSTKSLEASGFKQKLVIRNSNLFEMSTNSRLKIDLRDVEDSAIDELVNEKYSNLSPNAALRPLYQEWVLPNLVYVGGPSEVYYWSQLKGIFDNYDMPMPLLHLRSSHIIVPQKQLNAIQNIEISSFFKSEKAIVQQFGLEHNSISESLDNQIKNIEQALTGYTELVARSLGGFSVDQKLNKLKDKLKDVEELVNHQLIAKSKDNPGLNKVLKTKERLFNSENIQERNEHTLAHTGLISSGSIELLSHFGFNYSQKIGIFIT